MTRVEQPASEIEVVVVVSEDHRHAIDHVAHDLARRGLHVERTLRAIGMVTGSVAADKLRGLRLVEGVQTVEPAREIRVDPPLDQEGIK